MISKRMVNWRFMSKGWFGLTKVPQRETMAVCWVREDSSPDGLKQPLIRQKGVAESCSKFKEVLVFVLIIGQFLCLFDRSLIS